MKTSGKKARSPVEIIKDLPAGSALADGGHDHETRQFVGSGTEPVVKPCPHGGTPGHLGTAQQKGNGRSVIDRLGVHALDETKVIHDLGGVRHEFAHPSPRVPVLLKRFHRFQHELAARVAGHGAETFAAKVFLGHRSTMQLVQTRFVIKEIDVGGGAVLEKVNDALGLGGKVRSAERSSLPG